MSMKSLWVIAQNWLQKLLFTDDGEIFQLWQRPPVDLYLKVYLFNITNHEEFLAGRDKKLNVEEIGPYVYRWVFSIDACSN